MKRWIIYWFICLFGLFILGAVGAGRACTYVFLKAKDGSVVSVRSQEFYSNLGAQLQMVPRGTEYASQAPKGAKGGVRLSQLHR